MSVNAERCLVFDCGGEACVGILHPAAATAPNLGVLIVVGGPQYRVGSHRQFVLLARSLAAAGYPVLRFDYRGMGDSEGDVRDFRSVADDLRAAVDAFVRAQTSIRKIAVFGLCDAASAVLMHIADDPRVVGLMLANPWVRTEAGLARAHVQHYYRGRVFQKTFWKKLLGGRFQFRQAVASFFGALTKAKDSGGGAAVQSESDFVASMLAGVESFRGPTLLLLSGRDLTAREFEDRAQRDPGWSRALSKSDVSRRDLPDADHTFSGRTEADLLARMCTEWLGKTLQGHGS